MNWKMEQNTTFWRSLTSKTKWMKLPIYCQHFHITTWETMELGNFGVISPIRVSLKTHFFHFCCEKHKTIVRITIFLLFFFCCFLFFFSLFFLPENHFCRFVFLSLIKYMKKSSTLQKRFLLTILLVWNWGNKSR